MRILLPVHHFTDTPRSGLHTAIWNIASNLAAQGHEVHVISGYTELRNETEAGLREKGLHLHRAGQFDTHNLGGALALRSFLVALKLRMGMRFDWIFVIDTSRTPFQRFKLGARVATRALTPTSPAFREYFTSGDWQFDRSRKDAEEGWENREKPVWFRIMTAAAPFVFSLLGIKKHTDNTDVVFCQNTEILTDYEKTLPAHCVLLPNGVETAPLEKKTPVPIATDKHVFLYVGHIAKRFGLFRILPTLEAFLRGRNDAELWIIGKGSAELTAELEALQTRNPGRIRVLGEIRKEDIGPYYHASFALLNPAFYHGFSSAVVEAMYCAKPVIAPLHGGSRDVIVPGKEGFLIGPDEPEELTRSLSWLCDHPAEAAEMGRMGREKIENGYLWPQVVGRISDAFRVHA